MYQVTIKGRTIKELKIAVTDICAELKSGTIGGKVEKNLDVVKESSEEIAVKIKEFNDQEKHVEASIKEDNVSPIVGECSLEVAESHLDIEGIPWDKRIHTATKTKVKAGTWKTKRGLDATLVTQVKAELVQAKHLAANPPVIPTAPITATTPIVEQVVAAPVAIVESPTVDTPVVTQAQQITPVPTPTPMSANGHSIETFNVQFPMIIAGLITEGKISQQYVNQLKDYFKVEQIWQVSDAQKEEIFNMFTSPEQNLIQRAV